jgi:hypothetical protein
MWDLALMTISYKPLTLYISSQYGTRVLQTPLLKPLTTSSCVALVPHDLTLLDGFDIICNDLGKNASQICAITLKGLINLELS